MPVSISLKPLDDSLRSPFGPPLRAFNTQALLSGMRQNDGRIKSRLWRSGLPAAFDTRPLPWLVANPLFEQAIQLSGNLYGICLPVCCAAIEQWAVENGAKAGVPGAFYLYGY